MKKIKWIRSVIVIASIIFLAAFLISSIGLAEMHNFDVANGDDMNDGLSILTPTRTAKQKKKVDKFISNESKFRAEQIYPSSIGEVEIAFSNSLDNAEIDRIILGSEVITGWTAFAPYTWKASLQISPEAIKSNDEWLAYGCYEDFLKDSEWFWTGNILYINDAEGNPDITGKKITAVFSDQEPLIITGWTHSPPAVWKSILATSPEHVIVNDTWYFDWWWGPLYCWYGETGEPNTLYLRDADGNPDVTGKKIAAVTKRGGWSVTSGDFNGDGLSDVVQSTGREVYLNYGNNEFPSMPDQVLINPEGDLPFGFYVASAGDVNNDGFDELTVAMGWGDNKVYLYMGTPQGLSDTPATILYPPENYSEYGFGHEISRGGDINADGFSDILIGSGGDSPTYFCSYLGSPSGINATPDQVITYPGTGGIYLSFIGDINSDGFDEIAVSVSKTPPASDFEVYIYSGSPSGINPNPQILTISISSETTYRAGQVTPAGDLNGDGFADLLIGNQWADGYYLREGKAYIFYGSASGLSNSADVIIDNPNPEYNARFGESVDGIGDFNHDGFDDIVVGCPYGSYASIYYGSPEGVSSEPSLILSGINWLGWSVSRVGDIKGNGQNFIVVGEEFGATYLYALAATNTIDSDNDGLYDYLENAGCTDTFDADTDDDGISDGAEDANKNGVVDPGETDPCSIDTDGDGIQDGTELGITEPVPDPDEEGPLLGTDTNVFIADADSDTTTDPLNKDSDDDGAWDGTEDANHNGRVDAGETDPSNPSSYPAQTTYSIFDLGNMGGGKTTASAVNNHGVVVGTIDGNGGAFKWENGQTTILPFLNDTLPEAGATSINDKNEIVGFSPIWNWYHVVMWDSENNINDLVCCGFLPDINENSQVVFTSRDNQASILWEDDSWKIIVSYELNGIDQSGTNAINENGQVVGWGLDYSEEWYRFAYLWENDNLYDLNDLITDGYSGILDEAIDINNNGQIIGSSWLFEDGNVLDLGFSGAAAINEIGQIVGSNFLYENGRLYNLDELIESEISYTNLKANDINELGQIVGQFDVNGETHAFLMNPVLDFDCDGLPDTLENSTCTDPVDVDTDDDGISDGVEDANKNGVVDPGETNPCQEDTDGDGIQDGTELGITEPVPDPDEEGPLLGTDTNVFIADADSDTTTDPLNKDSDDDGAWDGKEDTNHNGRVDAGETDPSNPSSYPAQTTIHLKKGFNLIAIPSDVTNQPDLKDWLPVLGDSSEIEKVMVYDGQAGKFITLIPGDASNPSFMLQGGEGLIVYAKQDKEITFTSVLCSTHDLRQGFNLIGFACPANGYSAYQLLNDFGSQNVSSIQRYSTEKGAFETAGFDPDGRLAGVDFPIVPGESYFIFMKQEVFEL